MIAAIVLAIFLIVSHAPEEQTPPPSTPSTVSPEEAGKIILKRR